MDIKTESVKEDVIIVTALFMAIAGFFMGGFIFVILFRRILLAGFFGIMLLATILAMAEVRKDLIINKWTISPALISFAIALLIFGREEP